MKFCGVLPIWLPTEERVKLARASLKSLAKTETNGLEERPVFVAVYKGKEAENVVRSQELPQFECQYVEELKTIKSNDGAMAWAFTELAKARNDITHLHMLCDDWIYNPNWLLELQALIKRRPGARAWWVYRSAYEEIHKTLKIDGDVMVKSINGMGCFTTREWLEWGFDYRKCPRDTGLEGKISLDLLHPVKRPGERWVTARSYIINVGLRGVCQRPETPDFAIDFVGTGVRMNDESLEQPSELRQVTSTSGITLGGLLPRPLDTHSGRIYPPVQPFNLTLDMPDGWKLHVKLEKA